MSEVRSDMIVRDGHGDIAVVDPEEDPLELCRRLFCPHGSNVCRCTTLSRRSLPHAGPCRLGTR
jgi:hypothetical protein